MRSRIRIVATAGALAWALASGRPAQAQTSARAELQDLARAVGGAMVQPHSRTRAQVLFDLIAKLFRKELRILETRAPEEWAIAAIDIRAWAERTTYGYIDAYSTRGWIKSVIDGQARPIWVSEPLLETEPRDYGPPARPWEPQYVQREGAMRKTDELMSVFLAASMLALGPGDSVVLARTVGRGAAGARGSLGGSRVVFPPARRAGLISALTGGRLGRPTAIPREPVGGVERSALGGKVRFDGAGPTLPGGGAVLSGPFDGARSRTSGLKPYSGRTSAQGRALVPWAARKPIPAKTVRTFIDLAVAFPWALAQEIYEYPVRPLVKGIRNLIQDARELAATWGKE